MQKSTLAILVPTFNEIENIELVLRAMAEVQLSHQNWNFHVYVLDDSSPDGTGARVEQLAIELNRSGYHVQLLTRFKKKGLGKAYIFGFNYALNDHLVRPDFVMQMDADLSHDPKYIKNFIMNKYEIINIYYNYKFIYFHSINNTLILINSV